MYVLIAFIIAFIFLIFTQFEFYFLLKFKQYKPHLEFGFIFLTYKINFKNRIKNKKKIKKKKIDKLANKTLKKILIKIIRNTRFVIDIKIYIPIKAYSNIIIPDILVLTELSKFFIMSANKRYKFRVLSSYETFMLNGILTVSIWNIIKAILKSR